MQRGASFFNDKPHFLYPGTARVIYDPKLKISPGAFV